MRYLYDEVFKKKIFKKNHQPPLGNTIDASKLKPEPDIDSEHWVFCY
jgi:hypothetical protein